MSGADVTKERQEAAYQDSFDKLYDEFEICLDVFYLNLKDGFKEHEDHVQAFYSRYAHLKVLAKRICTFWYESDHEFQFKNESKFSKADMFLLRGALGEKGR